MANENTKDRRLIAYLLGQLSEAERTEIEDQYFANDAQFEYLTAVETELIDAYARGELQEADRGQFGQRFLVSSRLRARIALAMQLQTRVQPPAATSAPEASHGSAPRADAKNGDAKTAAAKKPTSPVVGAVAAGVVIAAVAVGWWSFQSSSSRAQMAGQSANPVALVQPVAVPLPAAPITLTAESLTPPPSGPVALVLAPGSAGSREGSAVLTMPAGAEFVRIQIDHDGQARERYAVIIATRERQRVWTELDMAPRAADAKGVVLQLPSASLPAGEYLVTLSGGTLKTKRLEALADYSLRVR